MKKRFICLAEDNAGKKYSGVFEAVDEDAARKMVAKEGLRIVSLKEDADPAKHYSKTDKNSWGNLKVDRFENVYSKLPPGKRKINWSNELLSYAMPVGAALIALAGIPLVMMFMKPDAPKMTPVQVMESFYEADAARNYEKQFEILSEKLQEHYGSAKEYEREMRNRSLKLGKRNLNQITDSGHSKTRATVTAALFTEKGLVKIEYGLKETRGKWKIVAIRDPSVMDAYLPLLDAAGEGDEARALVRELKAQTGYSDLEIEELLESYHKEQRALKKQEKGIDYIFDVS